VGGMGGVGGWSDAGATAATQERLRRRGSEESEDGKRILRLSLFCGCIAGFDLKACTYSGWDIFDYRLPITNNS
jgi:hypothetical protein